VFFFVDPAPAADCEDPLLDEPPFEPPELAEPPYDPAEFEYPELEEPEWETAGVRTGAGRAAACFWATDTFAAKALTVTDGQSLPWRHSAITDCDPRPRLSSP
jgi:hypothetical protein